jgi:formylglycine-generating enzyme required for sulfatase activity
MSGPGTDPVQAKMALVNALLACPSVQQRARRDAIIGLLPDAIQNATARNDDALTDVLNLVSTALNYEGGLTKLVEAVRCFEHDSLSMRQVDQVVSEWRRASEWRLPKSVTQPKGPRKPLRTVIIIVALGLVMLVLAVITYRAYWAIAGVTRAVEAQAATATAEAALQATVQAATPSPGATPVPQAGAAATGPNDMMLVYVPAGSFIMGSKDSDADAADSEKPQHEVYVEGFWIGRTEVTNAQYARCVEAGACNAPGTDEYKQPALANRPFAMVSWYDANAYAGWIGGRLPTEAEWEKACRGTEGATYPWGNAPPTADRLNYDSNVGHTTDVGSYPPGAYGLFDMAGNLYEWTASQLRPYPYQADDGRNDPVAEELRVLRGGAFGNNAGYVRCAARLRYFSSSANWNYGFRVVASPSHS